VLIAGAPHSEELEGRILEPKAAVSGIARNGPLVCRWLHKKVLALERRIYSLRPSKLNSVKL